MKFTNSPLVTYTRLSSHHSGQRNHDIDTITIHCIVGQWTAKQGCDYFATTDRECSSNYVVGKDGSIGLSVEEKNRSWCTSSGANDHRAITIEVASDTAHPYAVTDKAYAALIDLVTDICKRNNIKELKWKADKSLIGQVDKQNMTVHRWFANKSCPGEYLYERHGQIAAEVNARLGVDTPPAAGEVAEFSLGDVVRIKEGVTTYSDGKKMSSWVPSSKLYVRGFKDNNRVIISTLQSGDITGVVFASDLVLVQAVAKPEDKPVEEVNPSPAPPEEAPAPAPVLPTGAASTGSKEDEKKLWDFLIARIGNEYGVAGLMGNLYAESALRSNNLQGTYEKSLGYTDDTYTAGVDNGTYTNFVKDSAGYGLAQWTFWSRKQALLEYAKSVNKSISDFDMQMEFLWNELSKNYKSTLEALKSANSVREASTYVLIHYEAPANQGEEAQTKRADYSLKYYDAYGTPVEIPEEIPEQEENESTNQPNTNDGVVPPVSNEPTGEGEKTETDEAPEYIKTPEEAQNFIMRLLNHIIDFIVRLFSK